MKEVKSNARKYMGPIAFGVILFVGLWHLGSVARALGVLLGMLSFLFIGCSIAFILNTPLRMIETRLMAPLNKRLSNRWARMRRPIALLLTILLVLALVTFTVFMVLPQLIGAIQTLAMEIPVFLREAEVSLDSLAGDLGLDLSALDEALQLEEVDWQQIGDALITLLKSGAGTLLQGTFSAATTIVSTTVNLVVGAILAIYLLVGKEKLAGQAERTLRAYLSPSRVDRLLSIGALANRTFSNFIGGQFLEAVILGVMFFICMTLFRFPFAAMVSVLIGATAVIPIFGAFIGFIIGVFMILVDQGIVRAAWFCVMFFILQQIESDLIYPHVVGKSVMLPGLWVLVAVTLGGNLAGIPGMLIGVPLASVLYALLRQAVNRRNAAREMNLMASSEKSE